MCLIISFHVPQVVYPCRCQIAAISIPNATPCHAVSPSHPFFNLPAQLINPSHQPPPFRKLRTHIIYCLLQNYRLASPLTLEAWHKLGETIKAFSDCLSALLFWGGFELMLRRNTGAEGYIPEAIWLAFFSCSLNLGFSSRFPFELPAFAEPSLAGDVDMVLSIFSSLSLSVDDNN